MTLWSHLPTWTHPTLVWQLQCRQKRSSVITADELLLLLGATTEQLQVAIDRQQLTFQGAGFPIEQVLSALNASAPVQTAGRGSPGVPAIVKPCMGC